MMRDPDAWRWRQVLPMAFLPLLMGNVSTSPHPSTRLIVPAGGRVAPCNISIAVTPHCLGAIAGAVPTSTELEGFIDPASAMKGSHDADRMTRCRPGDLPSVCFRGQHGDTFVLEDARSVDLTQLVAGQSIIVGSFRLKHSARPEWYYNVGNGFPNNERSRRIFVVATYHQPRGAADTIAGYGHVVAEWRLYGLGPKERIIDYERAGLIWNCDHRHHDDENYSADFLNCRTQARLNAYSEKYGISFPRSVALFRCVSSSMRLARQTNRCAAVSDSLVARAGRGANRAERVAQLPEAMTAMYALVGELGFTDDPYWFSCAGGCCTAETRQ